MSEYYSQHSQDRFLDEHIFKGKTGGVFVEIGAFNGEAFSNTCFFERFRGWTGLCVEPLPHHFEAMKTKRNCIMLNACISDVEGEEDFLVCTGWCEMLSGLLKSYDPDHLKRIDREIQEYNCSKTIVKVPTLVLSKTLPYFHLDNIDYCSIDTEGSEMQVLRSIDFEKTQIYCFTIENNYKDNTIEKFMISKGYKKEKTLGTDELYLKVS